MCAPYDALRAPQNEVVDPGTPKRPGQIQRPLIEGDPRLAYDCGCRWSFIPEERFAEPRPGVDGGWYTTTMCRAHEALLHDQLEP